MEIKKYEIQLNELKNKEDIENKLTTYKNPHEAKEFMVDVLKFNILIEEEEKKMKATYAEANEKIKLMKGWVDDMKKEYSNMNLTFLKESPDAYIEVEKTWTDEETGEVKTWIKKERNLPKFVTVTEHKKEITYNEDKLPEEYFKKEIKKAAVKKAVKEGLLPEDVITVTEVEDPSSHISDTLAFISS